jgi:hypothetical protein
MTKEELLNLALDKGYFGNNEVLFAFPNRNMFSNKEFAEAYKNEIGVDYFVIEKNPKAAIEQPKEDTKKSKK